MYILEPGTWNLEPGTWNLGPAGWSIRHGVSSTGSFIRYVVPAKEEVSYEQ